MGHIEATRAPDATVGALLRLTSPAFRDGATIPARYTADGADVSPPLAWSEPPPATVSLALVCEDPDAPRGTFVHWLAWNIPATERELVEDVARTSELFELRQGDNDFGTPA